VKTVVDEGEPSSRSQDLGERTEVGEAEIAEIPNHVESALQEAFRSDR
jgi:hypothetical protein